MPQRLLNKVAVVTGAGSGIGRAVVEQMLAEGAKVVLFGRRAAPLEEVAERAPARSLVIAGDVTRPADLRALVDAAVRRFRTLDLIVPCAGTARVESATQPDSSAGEDILRVNFVGAVDTVRQCLPHLSRGGAILFLTAAFTDLGLPGFAAFNASKAALRAFARTLAVEVAPRVLRVNCLAPGPTETPFWRNLGLTDEQRQALVEQLRIRMPLPRFATPAEVAELAVFLASDAAQHITGQEFRVDGGLTTGFDNSGVS